MRELPVGDRTYRIQAVERDGRWIAKAERVDTGDPFGIECASQTETEAIDRLAQWLDWQYEHTAALDALQQAERAYHRTVAVSLSSHSSDGKMAIAQQKDSLDRVEAARIRLDELRAGNPE